MHDKFKGKYRIGSARKTGWDYSTPAKYFVTICTKDRECFFGDVVDKKMNLSIIGEIAQEIWLSIPNHFDFVKLHAFIVMPDHIHGILEILQIDDVKPRRNAIHRVSTDAIHPISTGTINRVSTDDSIDTPIPGGATGTNNPMLHSNLSRIIRWYKGKVTFLSRKNNSAFAWQSRFHDHIIRNKESFDKITSYIRKNPENWNHKYNLGHDF